MPVLHNVESTVDANPRKGVRIAIMSGQSLGHFLAMVVCSLHVATISTSDFFSDGVHPIVSFKKTIRTENVVLWPPFNTLLNSFVSSDFLWQMFLHPFFFSSPASSVCLNTHVSLPCASTFGFDVCGTNDRMWIPSFWHVLHLEMIADRFV